MSKPSIHPDDVMPIGEVAHYALRYLSSELTTVTKQREDAVRENRYTPIARTYYHAEVKRIQEEIGKLSTYFPEDEE